jgi:hypothetical protein
MSIVRASPGRRSFTNAGFLLRHALQPETAALWAGSRLGVLDSAVGLEMFAGLLDDQDGDLLRTARGGYIAGRAGMTTTEVPGQLDLERHEPVARMSGIGADKSPLTSYFPHVMGSISCEGSDLFL